MHSEVLLVCEGLMAERTLERSLVRVSAQVPLEPHTPIEDLAAAWDGAGKRVNVLASSKGLIAACRSCIFFGRLR